LSWWLCPDGSEDHVRRARDVGVSGATLRPSKKNMSNNLERVLNIVLTASALSIAGTLVYREVAPRPVPARGAPQQGVTFDDKWKKLWEAGTVVGNPTARVKIVEAFDLECPFCKRFNATMANVIATSPSDIAISYVHFPITGHRFGMPGARAAECAAAEGKFGSLVDLVYRQQDSLGEKTWATFAREAGVKDSISFAKCLTAKGVDRRIEAARDVALAAEVSGTPTVLINGWRFNVPPSETDLREAVTAVAAGRQPQPVKSK